MVSIHGEDGSEWVRLYQDQGVLRPFEHSSGVPRRLEKSTGFTARLATAARETFRSATGLLRFHSSQVNLPVLRPLNCTKVRTAVRKLGLEVKERPARDGCPLSRPIKEVCNGSFDEMPHTH
jgi:hypothetical protein